MLKNIEGDFRGRKDDEDDKSPSDDVPQTQPVTEEKAEQNQDVIGDWIDKHGGDSDDSK
ncbi:MAG: hypothetical protein WDZ94_02725 [Patescibacteria group bacterium]